MPTEEAKVEEVDLSKLQIERCVPIAQEIVKLVAGSDLKMGQMTKEELTEAYDKDVKSVLELFRAKDLQFQDALFTLQLVLQPFDFVLNGVRKATQMSFDAATVAKWGKHPEEVTFGEADALLKK